MKKGVFGWHGQWKKVLYTWHKRLGLIACLAIIMWGLSGVCHPLMNWTQPRPVKRSLSLPIAPDQLKLSPKEALERNGIERFAALSVISFSGHTYYRVKIRHADQSLYIDAQEGALLENGEAMYATFLAREYLNDWTHKITKVERLNAFSTEYGKINRLLPVYKVSFDRADGMRAYVDADSARLGTLVNDTKGELAWFFETFHNWTFFGADGPWRLIAALILAALASFAALSGLMIYGLLWKRFSVVKYNTRRGLLRRYHRQLGLIVSATMLSFSASGWLHALVGLLEKETVAATEAATVDFDSAHLGESLSQILTAEESNPITHISLVRLDGVPCYQIMRADGQIDYLTAQEGRTLTKDAEIRYARQLAGSFCKPVKDRVVSVTRIDQFNDEYGFIYKRLPVFKVQYDDDAHTRCYIDPIDGALAATFRDGLASFENWSFTRIHKWHFLNPLGTLWRDLLMIAFALGNVAVALSGAVTFLAPARLSLKMPNEQLHGRFNARA